MRRYGVQVSKVDGNLSDQLFQLPLQHESGEIIPARGGMSMYHSRGVTSTCKNQMKVQQREESTKPAQAAEGNKLQFTPLRSNGRAWNWEKRFNHCLFWKGGFGKGIRDAVLFLNYTFIRLFSFSSLFFGCWDEINLRESWRGRLLFRTPVTACALVTSRE